MRECLRFLVSRWFLSFVGVALLAVLVWFFGPFLAFLGRLDRPRSLVIAAMLADLARRSICARLRRRRREAALVEGVTAAAPDPTVTASAEEVAALRDKLTAALDAAEAGARHHAAISTSSPGT